MKYKTFAVAALAVCLAACSTAAPPERGVLSPRAAGGDKTVAVPAPKAAPAPPAAPAVATPAPAPTCPASANPTIRTLWVESLAVEERICSLQDKRKSIQRLITAIQEYDQSASAMNAEKLAKARELYEAQKGK